MTSYSVADAEQELLPILDKAPKGAVSGEWTASTMQAGHSSRTGGYLDANGDHVRQDPTEPLNVIEDIVARLEASATSKFNAVTIRWKKARFPWKRGDISIETRFDASTVPRRADDPIYDTVAATRRRFWQSLGAVGDAAQRGEPNSYGQTKWFGPHRRVLLVRRADDVILATDGLSTPWASIADPENGVECELMLELTGTDATDEERISLWANLLISIGDLVADGYRVARDVEKHRAILFCGLTDDYLPATRMILSATGETIPDMPFGAVPLIRATPVAEEEIPAQETDEDWDASTARAALQKRGIAT
ncbi:MULTISPECIES: hypothetical protein [unclassified Rhizobium]|uniref:hypothetical protein n=1 Tax=unclassified Rhizobium TaxID=2613769 RepID=UPI000714FADA|nr:MULTISPECIES: hypothetical protein [unclassified Rhizobium]KQS96637.1 hypothetical protein ASG50_06275 [Rhizobium sp. Leaf386]KQT92548.1 hypothetical protein ASG68_17275 [Rhizobium sp. Leaf453]